MVENVSAILDCSTKGKFIIMVTHSAQNLWPNQQLTTHICDEDSVLELRDTATSADCMINDVRKSSKARAGERSRKTR